MPKLNQDKTTIIKTHQMIYSWCYDWFYMLLTSFTEDPREYLSLLG